ncbi:MAG: adenylate/guanylate cyclase domain-containing protein, partial [Caldilineae bacterium]
ALPDEQVRSWLLPPVYERLRSGQGQFLAELRPATALFLRFGGLDYDADDDAGQKLDAYIQWVQRVLAHYDSYLFQLTIGDKGSYLYAAFGAPVAHEDDAARALAAAADLRATPPDFDFLHGIQIGLSQGRMRAGAYGGTMRRTYGVLGDEVNLAARLMGQAQAGQILVSKPVADAASQSYHFQSLGRIKIKGKEDPQPIFLLQARRLPSTQRPATLFTHPLVGRQREMAQLQAWLALARQGQGQIIRLEGEAGMGKSHLAAEFAEHARRQGFHLAVGTCLSTAQDTAYYPWRQAGRAFFQFDEQPLSLQEQTEWRKRQIAHLETLIKEANPAWLLRMPLLGDLLDLPIPDNPTTAAFDPQLRQEALFALVTDIVRNRAATEPLFLLLEDVHWMDEASRGLTLALARVTGDVPLCLVLVHRPPLEAADPLLPELARFPYHRHLPVRELSPEGTAALITNLLDGEPSPLTAMLIQAQSQGNPFFTGELVNALRDTGAIYRRHDGRWFLSDAIFNTLKEANCLTRANGEWQLAENVSLSAAELGIPDSIHGVVLARMDRLPEAYKLTLKVASVIGRIFELELLVHSHPVEKNRAVLTRQAQTLESYDFTRMEIPPPRLSYIFKHNVTQEVTYETLPEDQQRELHRVIAAHLEHLNPEAVEQLAYHYNRGGVRDKALLYLERAAQKAQREYANETALTYYNQALALEERWGWRKGQIEVLHILGRREEEAAALQKLEAHPDAPPFDVAYLWGRYYESTGDYSRAQTAIQQARRIARRHADTTRQARCLAQLGLIARRQGNYEQARTCFEDALSLFQGQEPQTEEATRALTQILNELGTICRQQGQFEAAQAHYERALTLSRKTGNRRREAEVLNSLGVTAYYRRDFATAIEHYRQALRIRQAIGDRAGEGTTLYNLASTLMDAGDYGPAQKAFSEALTIQQVTGNRWEEGNVWNTMGVLYHQLGDLLTARTCLQQGLGITREIGDEAGQAYILANLGLVARDDGDLSTARQVLTEGLALAEQQDDRYLMSYFLTYLSTVSLAEGGAEEAIEQAKGALDIRRQAGLQAFAADNLATLAAAHLSAGHADRARACAAEALSILDACGGEGPEFPQADYFACYRVLAALGEEPAARSALQAARQLVTDRAAKIRDPLLQQSFLKKVPINRQIMQA